MEKTKKRLALERKLSQSYLDDLERARGEVAHEMTKNISMVGRLLLLLLLGGGTAFFLIKFGCFVVVVVVVTQ